QDVCEGDGVTGQTDAALGFGGRDPIRDADLRAVAAGHEAGPARRTDRRRRERIAKQRPFARQPIHVRRPRPIASVRANAPRRSKVGYDSDDVELFGLGWAGLTEAVSKKEHCHGSHERAPPHSVTPTRATDETRMKHGCEKRERLKDHSFELDFGYYQ